jgi:beta-lactam-binding protein with PASTA domain
MFLKPSSIKDLLIHLAIIIAIVGGGFFYFFTQYLPKETRHGEELIVPDLRGKQIHQSTEVLQTLNLRQVINDSVYVEDEKPGKIISQHPRGGSTVKANRQIYLTVTSKNPTNIELPEDLTNKTLKNVTLILSQVGLYVGATQIVPDQFNLVLKATYNGKEISKGSILPKFSKVNLTIGSGYESEDVDVDSLAD